MFFTAIINKIKQDSILKNFWRDNARFADLFNTALFGGVPFLHPDDLREADTDVSSLLKFNGHAETIQKVFDVVKKTANGVDFVIWGLENQSKIHYAMPLRHMIEDAFSYLKEYNEIVSKNRKDNNFSSSDEFLSGFKKSDRLHPVISLCIYYGEDPWDGPLCLTDMLDVPEILKPLLTNHKINLIQVRDSEALNFQHPDVAAVFDISRSIYNEDYDKIRSYYNNQNPDFSAEIGMVIGAITESKQLIDYALELERDGGELNMCKALDKLINEGRQEGLQEGHQAGFQEGLQEGHLKGSILTYQKLNIPKEDACKNIMEDFSLSKAEAAEYVEKYW